MPDDPNPRRYVGLVDRGGVERTAQATGALLTALEATAGRESAASPDGARPVDKLSSTEWRLRTSAKLAAQLPPDLQTVACLLAVSLTGPDRQRIAAHPLIRPICQRIAGAPAGAERTAVAEHPPADIAPADVVTAPRGEQGRLERWLSAAALASLLGGQRADAAALVLSGIADPAADAVDLASYADACAGGCLAARLADRGRQPTLARLADEKDFSRFLPPAPDEMKLAATTLPRAEFERQYGSATDQRFLALRTKLCNQISALPAYR
jgi:hypothetical protein